MGAWVDDYVDSSGVDTTGSSNWTHSQAAQAVLQANPSSPAVIRTTLISPASASAWKSLYLKYSASAAADLEVRFVSADGLTSYPLGGGAFPLGASDDAAWNVRHRKADHLDSGCRRGLGLSHRPPRPRGL